MKVMNLRDVKAHLSAAIEESNEEQVLITSNGEPAAVLVGVKGYDMEEVMLVSNSKFWKLLEESRKSQRTLTAAEVRARIAKRAAAEARVEKKAAAPRKAATAKRVRAAG